MMNRYDSYATIESLREAQEGLKTKVLAVSPELAKAMLDRNIPRNRNIRSEVVAAYARDMALGRWQQNGDTLKVAVDGTLLDGQHRLKAVVRSGATVKLVFAYGISVDAFPTIDSGRPRNSADYLKFRDIPNGTAVAAAIKLLFRYQRDAWGQLAGDKINNTDIKMADTAEIMAMLVSSSRKAANGSGLLPSAVTVFLYLVDEARYPQNIVDSYLDGLATGAGLPVGDPRLALRGFYRSAIVAVRASSALIAKAHLYAQILAFNDFMNGRPRKLFRASVMVGISPQPSLLRYVDTA